jgi:hypothetical protein
MVRFRIAVWLTLPDVAVTVTFETPGAAEEAAANVPVNTPALPDAAPRAAKEDVTPAGSPEADRTKFAAVPEIAVMEAAVVPLSPWTTLKLAGARATAKFTGGGAVTVTVIATVAVRLPEVPLTVNDVALNAAELATVRVSVAVVALVGLSEAVTPVGKPVAL